MKTRLLIRPNSDIKILDTVYVDDFVGLLVEDLDQLDIQDGDLLSLEFNDTSQNPNYAGQQYVQSVSDYPNIITLRLRWGSSGPKNPGYIRNWLRIQESTAQVDPAFVLDRVYNFDINQLEVDKKGRYVHGGLYNNGTYSNVIGGRILQTGQLDPSFTIQQGFNDFPRAILMYDDGSMIIGGRFTTFNGVTHNRIVRIHEDGTVDPLFDVGTGFDNYVYGLAKHKKGIIVVGAFSNFNGTAAAGIIKLRLDGSIDPSFDYGSGLAGADKAYSVLTTSDNKVVVGGHFTGYDGNTSNKIVRINEDGSYDASFVVGSGADGNVLEIKEDLGGAIIFAGNFSNYDGDAFKGICKVDINGASDPSWSLPFDTAAVTTFEIQSNGKYLIAGNFTTFDGVSRNRIVRINQDLSLDTTFDPGTGFNAAASIKLLTNGQIVVYGGFTTYNGVSTVRLTRLDASAISIRFKTELFDLKEDIQFPLTFNIADIKEPEKRRSDFSKTITLPGTKTNNKIFSQLFDLGVDSKFNPNLKKDVICFQDGLQIFTGFMKLDKINRDDWKDFTYDIKISGQLTDIFSKLVVPTGDDLKISDLDFSEYDHTITRDIIINSWIGNIQKNGFTYSNYDIGTSYSVTDTSFIDGNFTQFNFTGGHDLEIGDVVRFEMSNPGSASVGFDQSQGHHTVIDTATNSVIVNLDFQSGAANPGILRKYESFGEGYIYPTVDYGVPNPTIMRIEDFNISFYVKNIIDKISEFTGFTFESDFFESQYFKRLIILGKSIELNNSRRFQVSLGEPIVFLTDDDYKFDVIPYDIVDNDDDVRFNSASYSYVNPTGENLISKFEIGINLFLPEISGLIVEVNFYRSFDPSGAFDPTWDDGFGNQLNDQGEDMFVTLAAFTGGQLTTFPGYLTDGFVNVTNLNGQNLSSIITTTEINLRPDEQFRVVFLYKANFDDYEVTMISSYFRSYDVKVSTLLPDITAKDLLSSLIQMHNLYLEPSRNNPRQLIVEPFNDYYQLDQDAKDWTEKVDTSIQAQIEPVSPNTPRNYIYKYSDDGDYLNKEYKDKNDLKTYGTFEISQDTEFNSTIITTQVKIPQTVLNERMVQNPGIIVPTIVKDINYGKVENYKSRILYWTGLRYAKSFIVLNQSYVGTATQSTSDYFGVPCYGYGGHFDSPVNATIDLNFGVLNNYYYGNGYSVKVTQNTLFSRYYKNYYDEITDKNTKLLTVYLRLNSNDISNLSFRRLYYIKNVLWRLQTISDYDPLSKESTKCEFIKVRRTSINTSFIPSSKGTVIYTLNPDKRGPYVVNPNSVNIGSHNETLNGGQLPNVTVGNGNYIGSIYTYVTGNNNETRNGGVNININGNGNTTNEGTIIKIDGSTNSIGTYSNSISVTGDRTEIGMSNSNVYSWGNDNSSIDGLTSSFLFGSNINATMSNTIYFGGNIVFNGTVSGLTASIPHYDAIGYYEGEDSGPYEVEQFTKPSAPYFRVFDYLTNPGPYQGVKNYIIGDTYSINEFYWVDVPVQGSVIIGGYDNYIGGNGGSLFSSIMTSRSSNMSGDENNELCLILGSDNVSMGGEIGNSSTCNIISSTNSFISGIYDIMNDVMYTATQSFIFASDNSNVIGGFRTGVIAGSGVTMSGNDNFNVIHNAVSIARNNFIATQSNMVYLPNVDIDGNSYIVGDLYVGGNIIGTVSNGNQNLQETLDYGYDAGGSILLMTGSNINLGSASNTIIGTNSQIIGGKDSSINGGEDSIIINSYMCSMQDGVQLSSIQSSFDSQIYGYVQNGFILGSSETSLFNSYQSSIINSGNVTIEDSYRSQIVISFANGDTFVPSAIYTSTQSFIYGCIGVTFSDLTQTGVMLLNDFSPTMSNTLYTPNQYIVGDLYVGGNIIGTVSGATTPNLQEVLDMGFTSNGLVLSMTNSNIVLGTASNIIYDGSYNFIGGGFGNDISIMSDYNFIGGGSSNNVNSNSSWNSVSGYDNGLTASYGNLVSGETNILSDTTRNSVSGRSNFISGGSENNVSGYGNGLTNSSWNIVSGYGNGLTFSANFNSVSGQFNSIRGSSARCNNVSGEYNILASSHMNNVLGERNGLTSSTRNSVSGAQHQISSSHNNNISGSSNRVTTSQDNIVSGTDNRFTSSFYSFASGASNRLSSCSYGGILSSNGVTMSNVQYTSVIGLNNFIATQSNTTYVDTINIQSVIQLKPLGATPSSPTKGMIFYNDTSGPKFYDGTVWRSFDFT